MAEATWQHLTIRSKDSTMTVMGNKPEWQPGGLDLLGSVEMADGAGICSGHAGQIGSQQVCCYIFIIKDDQEWMSSRLKSVIPEENRDPHFYT